MKMLKPASLFKWQPNGGSKTPTEPKLAKQPQKVWIHPPTALQNGHIAYLVKYFGNVEVEQPKGIEVVKESINRLKIKKTEGTKIPKVELTISVNGVAIQDPKSKNMYTQFPLHRISYCADDKTAKKFFSFIAKDVEADKNLCFVFMSQKMSEEIILTIGQAFDLAYAKFIESSGRELEIRKQLIMLQKKVCDLEEDNQRLKTRLAKYEPEVMNQTNMDTSCNDKTKTTTTPTNIESCKQNGHKNGLSSPSASMTPAVVVPPPLQPPPSGKSRHHSRELLSLIDVDLEDMQSQPPPAGPAPLMSPSSSLLPSATALMSDDLIDEDFDPRADDEKVETSVSNGNQETTKSDDDAQAKRDLFGSEPFQDPFGMGHFTSAQLNSAIVSIDKELAEMRHGFSQGLSADGFNLDP